MRKLLPGSVALIAAGGLGLWGLSVPAAAADLGIGAPTYKAAAPIMRTYDWTGFYFGGNAGGHWGSDEITTSTASFEGSSDAGAAIDAHSGVTLHPKGFIAGVQAGYNLEGSGGVFGIEVDANWLGGTASRSLSNIPGVADTLTNSAEATFLSTLRMRWGSTFFSDRSLLFITAGFAFGTLKTADSMGHGGNTTTSLVSGSTTEPGLVAGGGFEYAITDNFTAKAEYLYILLRSFDATIPSIGAGDSGIVVTHAYTEQVARFGLNFKFGGL
jgi:outer membrane immunogenic protein